MRYFTIFGKNSHKNIPAKINSLKIADACDGTRYLEHYQKVEIILEILCCSVDMKL